MARFAFFFTVKIAQEVYFAIKSILACLLFFVVRDHEILSYKNVQIATHWASSQTVYYERIIVMDADITALSLPSTRTHSLKERMQGR